MTSLSKGVFSTILYHKSRPRAHLRPLKRTATFIQKEDFLASSPEKKRNYWLNNMAGTSLKFEVLAPKARKRKTRIT